MRSIHFELHRLVSGRTGRARPTAVATAVATALGVFVTPDALCQTNTASPSELESLNTEMEQKNKQMEQKMEQLQRRIDGLEAQQAAAQTTPAPAPAPSSTPDPEGPGFKAGPVTVTFGGFTELATIYRNRNEVADIGSNFNGGIPLPNSSAAHTSEFRESARQSRLTILAQGPQDGNAVAQGYFEMDFVGAAATANSNEGNSYNPRMRQIYGTYARKDFGLYMLAGQAWSLATLEHQGLRGHSEQVPMTIDGSFVPGFNYTWNPQLRLIKEFNNQLSAGISIESPQANIFNGPNPLPPNTVFSNPGGSGFAPTSTYSTDVAPDVVAKVAFDPGFGHYELYGLARWFRDSVGVTRNTTTGGGVGGGFVLPVVSDVFDVQASALAGKGIGRYGAAQLPDVTLRPDGALATVSEYDVLLGANYRPTTDWTLYGYVGTEHADSRSFTAVVNGAHAGYGYGSDLYNNSGCYTLGSTLCAANTRSVDQVTAGAWWKYYQGALGNLQIGVQGSYTRRRTFAGVGGAPNANMTVGMVSFRFYPYQK
jgi:hypothetical protein